MTPLPFDTLALYRGLLDKGFTEQEAELAVEILVDETRKAQAKAQAEVAAKDEADRC